MSTRLLLERDVVMPMRDGVTLKADIYRPDATQPVPAILSRTPYSKESLLNHSLTLDAFRGAEAGYAIVFQDTRGRWDSEGEFYPYRHEIEDGYDSVEWLAAQPWCSGAVGMVGGSYIGATQWLAAIGQPPHLGAIAPNITSSEYYEGWTYLGGAFRLATMLFWVVSSLATDTARRRGMNDEMLRLALASERLDERDYGHLPLKELPLLRDSGLASYYFDWLDHPGSDDYWQQFTVKRHYGKIQVPAYNLGGWFDIFVGGTLENFVRMQQEGGSEAARKGQRLLMGPWSHGVFSGLFPDYNFGLVSSQDVIDITALQLRFFDYHLKGIDNGLADEAPVRLFVMGENRWRDEWEWPLARTRYEAWYLHSDGKASGGGELSPQAPSEEPTDSYLYDPRDPTPTAGGFTMIHGLMVGIHAGPHDQRTVEARPDVLVYTSTILEQPLEATGPLTFVLYAASSAPDTDFIIHLCDVHPDGAARILAEGIIRARYREGKDKARLLTPGEVYEFKIDLAGTSHVFLPGHRIRVDVMSSSFPNFDLNLNSGGIVGEEALSAARPALQTVYHDGARASHIVLPVIAR
jgi:putative CocE/NonD family hydrolase